MRKTDVLQIVADAARDKQAKLDLSNNQLSSLPPEILKLTYLIELDLSDNQLSSLPPS